MAGCRSGESSCSLPLSTLPPFSGFVVVDIVDDLETQGYGYIGYNNQTNEIVAGFRGSTTIQNWFDVHVGR